MGSLRSTNLLVERDYGHGNYDWNRLGIIYTLRARSTVAGKKERLRSSIYLLEYIEINSQPGTGTLIGVRPLGGAHKVHNCNIRT